MRALASTAGFAVMLAACSPVALPEVPVQRQIIFDCQESLGIRGLAKLTEPSGGLGVQILPFGEIDAAEAAKINACAAERVRPVAAAATTPRALPASRPAGPVCGPGASVMYGGSSYCVAR